LYSVFHLRNDRDDFFLFVGPGRGPLSQAIDEDRLIPSGARNTHACTTIGIIACSWDQEAVAVARTSEAIFCPRKRVFG
jgi:hypothetical protein